MKAFLIPLTVASSEARIYVNPDHIVFVREVNNGTQLVTTVINEGADSLVEAEFAGLAVEHGQEDHGEAFLQLGVLVELVEDDFGLGAAF